MQGALARTILKDHLPQMQDKQTTALNLLDDLLGRAKKAGAEAADAVYVTGVSLSLAQRLGEPEHLERSESQDVGLRVLMDRRQAMVSTSDPSPDTLDALCERAVAMARAVPEDPYCGLADPDQLVTVIPDIEPCDPVEPTAERLKDLAAWAEEAAMAVAGVSNSEGAEAGWGMDTVAIAASNGFAQAFANSHHSLSVSVLAGTGTEMESDYDFTSKVFAEDMESPEKIGKSAGEKAVRRLNPRKVETTQVPVIYDPRVSKSLLGHLAGAINGAAIARGTSFLKDKMGERIFSPGVNVIDDPLRKRGLGSRPFDGEGIATRQMNMVEDGRLNSWFLDLASGRQLGLKTTGHASRGTSSPPSPSSSNLYLQAGSMTPAELMADIGQGLYVTELIGFGVNGITGDYSRGAGGFWIEDGVISYPVSEVTIAGNLNDMFRNLTPADDLTFRYGTDAPTIRIDGMTLAGQ